MKRLLFCLLIFTNSSLDAQTKIIGRVMDADSNAVPFAAVRLPGLDAVQTDDEGFFAFDIPERIARSHFLKGGVDLHFEVEKEGMEVLEPPNRTIRLPYNWTYQKPFEIYLASKGSLLFVRSERMLEYLLRERIEAAVEAKEEEFARRDVLAEEAARLGLTKETLLTAVEKYKESLRTSEDLYKRGLAALDDYYAEREFKTKRQKLDTAEVNFREAARQDELALEEGQKAQQRLPDIYYNLGLTFFAKAGYDSAAVYFAKADSTAPGDVDRLNMLGRALDELAHYDEAYLVYQSAFTIDTATHGRNHPNVAIRLNNIAGVLESKGDYAGALEKYTEALKIDESYFGRHHPKVAIRLNNIASVLYAKGDYAGALEKYTEALKIDESYFGRNHPKVAIRLNNIGEVLREQGDYAGALEKYTEALKIFEAAFGREHPNVATGLNNIAGVLKAQGDYAGALEKYTEALTIFEAAFGREHPNVATGLNNIAGVLYAKGDYDGALEKYTEALKIDESYFGRNHPDVAIDLNNIAFVLESKGDYAGALEKFREAEKIFVEFLGAEHPNTKTVRENINYINELMKREKQEGKPK